MLKQAEVRDLVRQQMGPAMSAERTRLDVIDRWYRWDHDDPHKPHGKQTREYRELGKRAQTPWLRLVVESVAQILYVDGYRRHADPENAESWRIWQANGMDSRQLAVHRAALAYGLCYATVLPGVDPLTGEPTPVIRGRSPRRMITFYADPTEDDWPLYAMQIDPVRRFVGASKLAGAGGWFVKVYDDDAVHTLEASESYDTINYLEHRRHGAGLCPVVRYANDLDLEGRADGEVEPFIPVAGRIDQTTFDRLVVQRFASWVVRTISGMAPPAEDDESTSIEQEKLRLAAEDILVAESPDTRFGSLPATPLDGFIKAHESDIHALAAVSQTPPNQLLGQMVNLSAEALAAAEASLSRKAEARKTSFGESHEKTLRLAAHVAGDAEGARDVESQVRWRDMESRSLAQAADALGKLAQMLGVPVEMLWEKIPGFTQQDVERAKALADQGGLQSVLQELANAQVSPGGIDG